MTWYEKKNHILKLEKGKSHVFWLSGILNILISSWPQQARQAVGPIPAVVLCSLPPSLLAEDPSTEPVAASRFRSRDEAFTGEAFFLL